LKESSADEARETALAFPTLRLLLVGKASELDRPHLVGYLACLE
jgi:hypothetical protein